MGQAVKARLAQVLEQAADHARSHLERVGVLEGQLGLALKRGHKLRQHVKQMQVRVNEEGASG